VGPWSRRLEKYSRDDAARAGVHNKKSTACRKNGTIKKAIGKAQQERGETEPKRGVWLCSSKKKKNSHPKQHRDRELGEGFGKKKWGKYCWGPESAEQ